jgi:hypothetical protein
MKNFDPAAAFLYVVFFIAAPIALCSISKYIYSNASEAQVFCCTCEDCKCEDCTCIQGEPCNCVDCDSCEDCISGEVADDTAIPPQPDNLE